MKQAKLIEVSGCDGSGKTTALKYLIDNLRARGFKVLETREVGSPLIPVCVKLRELVLDVNSDLDGSEMEMIFAAMRLRQHRLYKSVMRDYDFIVSDRGYLDHLAYTDHNVDANFTDMLYTKFIATLTRMPDLVLYFNVNTETALKRRVKRGEGMDAIEIKGVAFQEKVRESFIKYLSQGDQQRVMIIDANQSKLEVQARVDGIVVILSTEAAE